jgi:hypothetical protein
MPRNLRIPDMSSGLSISTIAITLSGSTRQPDESILVDIVVIGYPLELVRLANYFRNACQRRLKGFQQFYVTWTTCSYVDLRGKNTTNV